MRPPRVPRALRGGAAGTVATVGALLSHLAGGGTLPAVLGIAVPWVLSLVVCVLLAGQRLSLLRLTIAVAVSQTLFHMLFVLGAPPTSAGGVPAGGMAGGMAGHQMPNGHHMHGEMMHGGMPTGAPLPLDATMPPGTPMPPDTTVPDMTPVAHHAATMWFWHAFAAVVTIAIVHRGERTLLDLHAVARAVTSRARRTLLLPVPATAPPTPDGLVRIPVAARPVAPADEPFLVSVGRRGPPETAITRMS